MERFSRVICGRAGDGGGVVVGGESLADWGCAGEEGAGGCGWVSSLRGRRFPGYAPTGWEEEMSRMMYWV